MRTLTPGSLLSPFYKDTLALSSEGPAFLACANETSDDRERSSRRREWAAHNPVLITLEQTDACDYRCRCTRCAVGVGVWKFDEPRELVRQQRSERQCQHNQLE